MVEFYIETEGYTKSVLKNVIPVIEKCGIKYIFNHQFLSGAVCEGLTLAQNKRIVDDSNASFPLQPNSAYFVCKFEDKKDSDLAYRSPLGKLLTEKTPSQKHTYITSTKGCQTTNTCADWDTLIQKDITFLGQGSTSLGWYNKNLNILFMGDVGGDEKTSESNLREIFNVILRFRNTGFMPPMKLTIGADPEMEFIGQGGELINASFLFPDPGNKNEVGCDGHSATGEIRPKYSTSPLKVARNIKRLLRKIQSNPNISGGIKTYAGGGTKVITGGHIHFGTKVFPDVLRKALWKMVAEPVLAHQGPFRHQNASDKCVENGSDIVRSQNHGTEWRPLPSFIINEATTKAVLCTAYAIVKSYFNGGLPDPINNYSYTKLKLYHAYKPYVDEFVSMFVNSDGTKKLEKRDIIKEWKLDKMNLRSATVVVDSPVEWMRSFFSPLYVKINKPIRIYLAFSPTEVLYAGNIPPLASKSLEEFALEHFVEKDTKNITIESIAKNVMGIKFPIKPDMVLLLPLVWNKKLNGKKLYQAIKVILKQAILETSNK